MKHHKMIMFSVGGGSEFLNRLSGMFAVIDRAGE